MRVTYDPAADAMYLYLTERSPGTPDVARTEEVATGVMLDFDAEDRVIGIEVLAVSRLPDAKPMQIRDPDVLRRRGGGKVIPAPRSPDPSIGRLVTPGLDP